MAEPQRDSTGTIVDQTPAVSPAATPSTPTTTPSPPAAATPPAEPKQETSLLNEGGAATGAPEKYEAFKVPEGWELDAKVSEEASTLFKGMNLSQEQAQQMVDLYSKHSIETQNALLDGVRRQNEEWQAAVKADPEIGGKLDVVKQTVSRALDSLGDPGLVRDFKEAMDYTGAGNHPAFIKAFYKLAARLTEGTLVRGNGPSPHGTPEPVRRPGASAMYPTLPSSGG